MIPYIFVIASALAIIPILILFKITIEKIKENPKHIEKAQLRFFISVAISEVIPILLVIYGFMNLSPVQAMNELYMPGIIILLLMGFAAFFIFLQRIVDVDENIQGVVTVFSLIGLSLVNAIPIIGIVALFTMMP